MDVQLEQPSQMEKCLKVLSEAANKQPGNEKEIFQILIQLPSITKTYLPYNFNHHSIADDGDENGANTKPLLKQLITSLAKGFTDRLKKLLHHTDSDSFERLSRQTEGQTACLCECIDSLGVLGGQEFAKEKLSQALTWRLDLLLQHNMEYVADILANIEQVERNFAALVGDVKILALDINKALFLCENISLTNEQQVDFISGSILEKLSIELLTLVDAVKEAVLKQSSPLAVKASVGSAPQYNLFSALTATIGEDAFLRQNELVSLANIVSLFLDLESELHLSDYTKLLKDKLTMERSKKSSLKSASQLPDLLRSSHQSSLIRSTEAYGHWNWQEILNDIGPIIARSLGKAFDDCQTGEINTARNNYHVDDLCNLTLTTSSSSSLYKTNSGVPRKTISCFVELLKLMKTFLPLATLGSQYKPLLGMCSQYVDECGQALKSMKSFLMTILGDVPSKALVTNLYYALATCEDVCTMLTYCASKIQPDPRVPFQGILQVYKDLNKMLRDTIIHHQHARLSTYLLHDAESHHWSDPRELNEGECPSYSIQMWNIFLQKLWFELSSCVSEVQRHRIFMEVFTGSIDVLNQRYLRCTPSYNRTKQVRLDITSILLVCSSFKFHTNFNPNAIFPADVQWPSLEVKRLQSKVHAACQNLLSVLCVLACPLDVLQKVLSDHCPSSAEHGLNWQYFVHPSTFPKNWDEHFSSLSDEVAVYFTLSFCSIHSSQSLVHCFYSLVMRKCFLLKKLLSHKLKLDESTLSELEENIFLLFSSCGDSFTDVFFKCAYKSTKQNAVSLLAACLHESDNEDYHQPWQKYFFSALHSTMCGSLSKVVKYITHLTWSPMGLTAISSLPSTLQGLIIDLSASDGNEGNANCLLVCLLLMVQGLIHCIYSLPEWLATFLANVVKVTSHNAFDADHGAPAIPHGDCALHILVHAAASCLSSEERWEEDHGIELKRENLEVMERGANMFVSFYKEGGLPNGAKQMIDLVMQEMDNLRKTSSDYFSDHKLKDGFECSDQQLFEECMRLVMDMKTQQRVINSLEHTRYLLTHNLGLIKSEWKLGARSNAKHNQASGLQDKGTFNPLTAHVTVGDDNLDRSALIDFQWNWSELSSMVIEHKGIKLTHAMLERRWEMRGDALLQDEEKKLVGNIKSHIAHLGKPPESEQAEG